MNILALSDSFIESEVMETGLEKLKKIGNVEVRHWYHESIEALQEDNLKVELKGPEGIELSEDLTKGLDKFDIIITQFTPISKAFIDKAENVKMIGVLRGGIENINYKYAKEKGISVMNTPGRNARAVAEFTIGMILSEMRNIGRSHYSLKNVDWRKDFSNSDNIRELKYLTVGLVGFGHIGQLVASYLKPFGCKIKAYDPYYKGDVDYVEMVELDELLESADVVSIHARLVEDTIDLIDKRELDLMKETAVLINTARSGLVNQDALVEVLSKKEIAGAALDVFDREPIPEDDEILQLDNITMTAHIGGTTNDAFSQSPVMMSDHILRMVDGKEDLPIVNGVKAKF